MFAVVITQSQQDQVDTAAHALFMVHEKAPLSMSSDHVLSLLIQLFWSDLKSLIVS